ncbi:IS1634 family transposase [Occultella glacieicola]|uniref:IS1634 family transposase n=2 Tax=Occultella glacieicola TaxID=2518684 RepID=A0ABY2E633_9MICO|nr:IS1634 family transposase [Occultella glacieicola]
MRNSVTRRSGRWCWPGSSSPPRKRTPSGTWRRSAPAPHLNTLYNSLKRSRERDYRDMLATACLAHSARTTGTAALIMYDVTTLHFENADEDELRRLGMSKEHRVDPQVQVGLMVDPGGFPLEVHLFEGNKAETTTLVPVLTAFQERHGVTDMVVVADAGMLSAGNLNALEEAGFSFIVGSRLTKPPTTWPTISSVTGTTSPTGRSWSRPG